MRKWFGLAFAFAIGGLASMDARRGGSPEEAPPTLGADTVRAVLEVRGMTCASCASSVEAMLGRTPGVFKAAVSAERAEAVVDFDAARIRAANIVEVVERLGYRAKIKEPAKTYKGAGA